MLFVGNDWAEAHHDIEIVDDQGQVLARRRLPEGVAGLAALHALVADHLGEDDEPEQVLVGIETDRGPWVQALIAAGYTVYPINPLQVARYRERHGASGAKSDPGDAHVLAEIVRLDRAHHRPAAGDTRDRGAGAAGRPGAPVDDLDAATLGEHAALAAARVLPGRAGRVRRRPGRPGRARRARRRARPGAGPPAHAGPGRGPAAQGRPATQPRRPAPSEIVAALRTEQLPARAGLVAAYAASVSALVAVITAMVAQTAVLEEQVRQGFGQHPDAEIYLSQPGLGTILGARVLAEFGDDPDRYADARARKNYAGMAPITRASGTKRVVLARYARNRRLADALYQQAFAALTASPGARAYYDRHRARGATHHQALRALGQPTRRHPPRLPAPPHPYNENTAWARPTPTHTVAA